MIRQAYLTQLVQHGIPAKEAEELWQEIETAYTEPDRFFHDLSHLEHLYKELHPLKHLFDDWDTAFFSLVYHDVSYNITQYVVAGDNEERSAAFAEQHLKKINYPNEKIERCRQQILATKTHGTHVDNDTDFFTDADLCILGQDWNLYTNYKQNIRKEFGIYPDSIYNVGRRKVLEHFQRMEPLFKTAHFRNLYEKEAKENIRKELLQLQA